MMFALYLHETESGGYSGFVPDVEGCYFAGDTFEEAVADAESAIEVHLAFLVDKGGVVPQPRSVEVHQEDEACQGGSWAFVNVYAV